MFYSKNPRFPLYASWLLHVPRSQYLLKWEMECFGIILEKYLACILYSWFLKVHIFFFWKLPSFTVVLRHKGKASLRELALFFDHNILLPFLHKKSWMSFISTTYYLSHFLYLIHEDLHGFGKSFLHLWGIWLDLVSLLFDQLEWQPSAFESLI